MAAPEIDALLIKHLGDIDDGAKRLDILQEKIAATMDDLCRKWASKNGWRSYCSWNEEELTVAAPEWVDGDEAEEDSYSAWLWLDYGHGDSGKGIGDEDCFWLTRLCGAGNGVMGFRFGQRVLAKTEWKKISRRSVSQLSGTRFILDEGANFFLPFRVETLTLAEAVANDSIEDGLAEFEAALDQLLLAGPVLSEMVGLRRAPTHRKRR